MKPRARADVGYDAVSAVYRRQPEVTVTKWLVSSLLVVLLPALTFAQGGPCNPYETSCAQALVPQETTSPPLGPAGFVQPYVSQPPVWNEPFVTWHVNELYFTDCGWLVLENLNASRAQYVTVVMRFDSLSGRPPTYAYKLLQPGERKSVSLHEDASLKGMFLSITLYFASNGIGHASTSNCAEVPTVVTAQEVR
jgi:hypothetical protein